MLTQDLRFQCLQEAIKHIGNVTTDNCTVVKDPITLANEFYEFVESGKVPTETSINQVISLTP